MASTPEYKSILRLLDEYKNEYADDDYSRSYFVKDETNDETVAICHVKKTPLFKELVITDNKNGQWSMRPHRKVMPKRWFIKQADIEQKYEIRLPGFFSMMNPFSRLFLTLQIKVLIDI